MCSQRRERGFRRQVLSRIQKVSTTEMWSGCPFSNFAARELFLHLATRPRLPIAEQCGLCAVTRNVDTRRSLAETLYLV
jgi:hypothetical protein